MIATKSWTRTSIALLAAMLLLSAFFVGCSEEREIDEEQFFSLEDYADDQDYARTLISMMNDVYITTERAKQYLDGNTDNPTFAEATPQGWVPTENNWYEKSFQDAYYELVRFDQGVPETAPLSPARVEYGRFEQIAPPDDVGDVADSVTVAAAVGTVVSIAYTNDYSNPSSIDGQTLYGGIDLLSIASTVGGAQASFPAIMENTWNTTFTQASPSAGNPQANYSLEGSTMLMRTDSRESISLDIEASIEIRSNGRGSAELWVEDVLRTRVFFTSISDRFHGYYTLASEDFVGRTSF